MSFKPFITAFLCLVLVNVCVAQLSLSDTSTVTYSGNTDSFNIKVANYVHNNGSAVTLLRWVRVKDSLPVDWWSAVCDPVICHVPSTNAADFILNPGDSAKIEIRPDHRSQFLGYHNPGTAKIEIIIFDPADSINTAVIAKYEVNLTPGSNNYGSGFDNLLSNSLAVYPNPTNGFASMYLSGIPAEQPTHIKILNLNGQTIAAHRLVNHYMLSKGVFGLGTVDLTEFEAGVYRLYFFANEELIAVKPLIKID